MPAYDWQLILLGTGLGVLAYPPFHLLVPSFLLLLPAVRLVQLGARDARPVGRWLSQGFWFGALTTSTVMYGAVPALWRFSPPAVVGFLAVPCLWGLYHALLFWFVGWCVARFRLSLVAVFPVGWTALEWVVGHQAGLAFPWLGLGTSLTGFPVLVQIADVIGARGVTYLLALANTALAVALFDDRKRVLSLASVAGGIALSAGYGWYRWSTTELIPAGRVALVQPAATIAEKADPGRYDELVDRLLAQTTALAGGPVVDLVVWPETALPGPTDANPDWVALIEEAVAQSGAPVLTGVLESTPDGTRNAAVLFGDHGLARQAYFKRYLVPLVERVPILARLAGEEEGGFVPGREATVFRTDRGDFGVLICYESAFERAARDYRLSGASFLVNLTNDAWLEGTTGMSQHPAHLVMRAIETRMGIARVANTGLSHFVDPLGRVYDRIDPGIPKIGTGVVMTTGALPPYARLGDLVGPLCLALVVVTLPASRIFRMGGRPRAI